MGIAGSIPSEECRRTLWSGLTELEQLLITKPYNVQRERLRRTAICGAPVTLPRGDSVVIILAASRPPLSLHSPSGPHRLLSDR
jgi:hypothetical protein